MNIFYSSDYKHLPDNWSPPTWISPELSLETPSKEITEKIRNVTQEKIYDPCGSHPVTHFLRSNLATCSVAVSGVAALSAQGAILFHYIPPLAAAAAAVGIGITSTVSLYQLGKRILKNKNKLDNNDLQKMLDEALKNPLFQQVYCTVVKKHNLKLNVTSKHLEKGGHSFALCKISSTCIKISIMDSLDRNYAFYGLIFEIVNAHQYERFMQVGATAYEGKLSREEYTILMEYVEFTTCKQTLEIIEYGIEHLNWHPSINLLSGFNKTFSKADKARVHPFILRWQDSNYMHFGYTESHAEGNRRRWDKAYRDAYQKNRGSNPLDATMDKGDN